MKGLIIGVSIAIASLLQGCAAIPPVLGVAAQLLPVLQIGGAVAMNAWCSELVGAERRSAARERIWGNPDVTPIDREGC